MYVEQLIPNYLDLLFNSAIFSRLGITYKVYHMYFQQSSGSRIYVPYKFHLSSTVQLA